MNNYKSLLLFALLFFFTKFRIPVDDGINVVITNLRSNKGHVLVSLFNSSAGFPDNANKALRKVQLSINNNVATTNFSGLPAGNYAIGILHDENDDQKMNTNIFGIPKEGYGFSNNVMGTFGPPSFSRASFNHAANASTQLRIVTKYGF
jgi:uncharacterized protein (DUF2141 family)